jgi:signal transduction histidine kinase
MKVLIIEDEKKLARLLKQGLEENGFTVDLAHDGADGQYQVENYAYDAVLLDLMLPEVDGLTILASLRNQGSDVPVLIITARGEVEDRIKGLNLGADDYLAKPFDLDELILLLSLMSWWIVRTSLTPLGRFAGTIETITHKNLDERIDTGTTVRELAGIARSFNDMLDRLHHVFESQKRLVADASHELKTPLAVIRTQCDVTLQKERTAAEYGEALNTIRSETRSITRLVNDLFSLAKLDAGLVDAAGFAPVRVRDLADHALRLTAPLASRQEVRMTVAVDYTLQVHGVRSSLEEAVLNLVENAVRYNRPGGEVRLTAAPYERGQIAIEVHDTGIGISTTDRERIFERFYRAAAVRSRDGSGLGLSIVKAIIEAHGGRILVVSDPEVGSNFTLFLPATTASDDAINREHQGNR